MCSDVNNCGIYRNKPYSCYNYCLHRLYMLVVKHKQKSLGIYAYHSTLYKFCVQCQMNKNNNTY